MTTLARAFTDRARRLRADLPGQWVEGEWEDATVTGAIFNCQLVVTTESERDGRTSSVARLLYGAGTALEPADQVEIESAGHGTGRWLVDGNPRPLLRRRRVVAFEATLRRVGGAARGR